MNRGADYAKSDVYNWILKKAYGRPIDLPCFVTGFQIHGFMLQIMQASGRRSTAPHHGTCLGNILAAIERCYPHRNTVDSRFD